MKIFNFISWTTFIVIIYLLFVKCELKREMGHSRSMINQYRMMVEEGDKRGCPIYMSIAGNCYEWKKLVKEEKEAKRIRNIAQEEIHERYILNKTIIVEKNLIKKQRDEWNAWKKSMNVWKSCINQFKYWDVRSKSPVDYSYIYNYLSMQPRGAMNADVGSRAFIECVNR